MSVAAYVRDAFTVTVRNPLPPGRHVVVDVVRPGRVSDGAGGFREGAPVVIKPGASIRLYPPTKARIRSDTDEKGTVVVETWTVLMTYDVADVRKDDRFTVDGQTFVFIEDPMPHATDGVVTGWSGRVRLVR